MGLQKGVQLQKEWLYDFAVDGGVIGAISLKSTDPSGDLLDAEFVVEDIEVIAEAAFTSGGSATVTLGNTADADGYLVDSFASLSLGAVLRAGELDGALIWNTALDAKRAYPITSAANTQNMLLTIGTAALTAGKLRVVAKGFVPTSAPIKEV